MVKLHLRARVRENVFEDADDTNTYGEHGFEGGGQAERPAELVDPNMEADRPIL
jgi:hypothetical protein